MEFAISCSRSKIRPDDAAVGIGVSRPTYIFYIPLTSVVPQPSSCTLSMQPDGLLDAGGPEYWKWLLWRREENLRIRGQSSLRASHRLMIPPSTWRSPKPGVHCVSHVMKAIFEKYLRTFKMSSRRGGDVLFTSWLRSPLALVGYASCDAVQSCIIVKISESNHC